MKSQVLIALALIVVMYELVPSEASCGGGYYPRRPCGGYGGYGLGGYDSGFPGYGYGYGGVYGFPGYGGGYGFPGYGGGYGYGCRRCPYSCGRRRDFGGDIVPYNAGDDNDDEDSSDLASD
ncbi:glycine-rich protein [Nilaparvata lugens]|uniref:glycine-rich protein n=1 Tax=Nilaparvata lugens TaxID=108931 RepID=UPI00193D87C6|nr:glycine-rich protein [Nilaparvata lugens]